MAEVTDQNFADEDQEASSSCMPMVKRMKTATADTTSNDQVNCDIIMLYIATSMNDAIHYLHFQNPFMGAGGPF